MHKTVVGRRCHVDQVTKVRVGSVFGLLESIFNDGLLLNKVCTEL